MNILMVLSSQTYPPDRRVEREARDLIGDGHKVFLMARRGQAQAREEIVDGVHVIRVPLPFQERRIIADMIYYLFQRYLILFYIWSACRKHRIDALHVHDLPYAFATVIAGKLLRIPVVFDMHENYTRMLEMGFEAESHRKFKSFAFLLLGLLRIEERIACRWAHKVIVVAKEHIARICSLGADRDNIIEVTNTEDFDYFSGLPIDESSADIPDDSFTILFVGVINPHRGLETAIRALPAILEKVPNARLVIVGDGVSRGELERLAKQRGLTDHIVFAGYQPFAKLATYIHRSDVGLIPHHATPHTQTTMPNKIFQFMIMGRPVLVSDVRPLVRVVTDADCGVAFKDRDPQSLAEAVIQLQDEGLRRRLGQNGKQAAGDRYNWRETVQALLQVYRTIPSRRG